MKDFTWNTIYEIIFAAAILILALEVSSTAHAEDTGVTDKKQYIKSGDAIFFSSPNYGRVYPYGNLTLRNFDKWTFVTTSGYILKLTFLSIEMGGSYQYPFEPCKDNITIYDGFRVNNFFLLAKLCGIKWNTRPIIHSSSNSATISFHINEMKFGGFLAYVESISESSIPHSAFLCNSQVTVTNDSVYLFPSSFPGLHFQSYKCFFVLNIPEEDKMNSYGEFNILSLSINPGKAKREKECNNHLKIKYLPKERNTHSMFVSKRFCGYMPAKDPIEFRYSLEMHFVSKKQYVNQGFFALITLKFCPNEMKWDKAYCSQVSTVTCDTVQSIELEENFLPSCHSDCKCPVHKPIWHIDRCLSTVDCPANFISQEFSHPTQIIQRDDSHRRKREAELLKRTVLDLTTSDHSVSEVSHRSRRSIVHLLCGDLSLKQGFCSFSKAMGHCIRQSVIDECRHTCGYCTSLASWSDWSEWSSCTRQCTGGKRMRIKSCINCDVTKVDVEDCPSSRCEGNELVKTGRGSSSYQDPNRMFRIKPRVYTGTGTGLEKDNKEFKCGANGFACETYNHCVKDTAQCNGYYECKDESDEPGTCPLGFRFDGKFVIQNWETHKCIDVKNERDPIEDPIPWGFRRCPGQKSPELDRYWWRYMVGRRIEFRGLIRHEQSRMCLTLNVTQTDGNVFLAVVMSPCDYSYRNRFQLWDCEPYSYRVKLTFPRRVLPRGHWRKRYLSLSKEGPGLYLNMTGRISEATTDFIMLETDRKAICSGREISFPFIPPSTCSKTCGNGTMEVLRECARHGKMDCNDGKRYKTIPCNTQPCIDFCPPGFATFEPEINPKDINCFGVFKQSKTFREAQEFCAAKNWTLAAVKDSNTHEFLVNLLEGTKRSYIGVYEDLSKSPEDPPSHDLRFEYDDQPVGGFHPWDSYGTKDDADLPGCVIGRGGSYYGTETLREECKDWPQGPGFLEPFEQLVPPYFKLTNGSNYCRNPNLHPSGPWCYTDKKGGFQFCNITNCLEPKSADGFKMFPDIDFQHRFVIRSLHGKYWQRKWCLSAINPNPDRPGFARPWPCDTDDELQQFFWWSSTSLVNFGLKQCLSLNLGPPRHGDRLVFKPCDKKLAHTYQAFKAKEHTFLAGWKPDTGILGTRQQLMKLVYHPNKFTATLYNMRRDLFVMHSKTLGMVRASTLLSKTPAGPYVLLRSCGACLTHDIQKGFDLIRSGPCSQQHAAQRWVIIDDGRLMNSESGRCLAGYEMQAYAIMRRCDQTDPSQFWNWDRSISENITQAEASKIKHRQTRSFLRCDCRGLSTICLSATSTLSDTTFEFLPGPVRSTPLGRAAAKQRASARGILGYPFFFQNSANLTKCARPQATFELISNDRRRFTALKIVFLPCRLEDSGFLWWFSGIVTQIKHRNLDMCLDSIIDVKNIKDDEDFEEREVNLRRCSLSRLDYQSWVFSAGPTPRDPNELPGDYIRLAVDQRYHLSIKVVKNKQDDANEKDFVLVLHREDDTDKWDAFTMLHNAVGVQEMSDCALPWLKMDKYRGTRSWTRYGIRCQPWKSQMPHRHPFYPKEYSDYDLVENRCRRPPGPPVAIMNAKVEDHAFCMTLDPEIPWQDCLVSKCPTPAVVSMDAVTRTWETSLGKERQPFTCQTTGECYYGVGLTFHGYTNWTGRGFCLNWRRYYRGDKSWPDHGHCLNPSKSFMKPWCWVQLNVSQYCDTVIPCVKRCQSPFTKLSRMKIASISYTTSSHLYAVGTSVQVVCKQGYNLTFGNGSNAQVITCTKDVTWEPRLIECRKIFCPRPVEVKNAQLLTTRARYVYGSTAAYQCNVGHMVAPGRISIEIVCLKSGEWSDPLYECLPSCPYGWTSFNYSCYSVRSDYKLWESYDGAQKQCKKDDGRLAIPTNEVAYNVLKYLIQKDFGSSNYLYWIGVEDVGTSRRYPGNREWDNPANLTDMYLEKIEEYHQFKINLYGFLFFDEPRIIYSDRCLYADYLTKKVLLKSCHFDNQSGLLWTWVTHKHLFNIDLGLCLSMDEFTSSTSNTGVQVASVRVEKCDLESLSQSLICGPHSPYLLKSRSFAATYLSVEANDKLGEAKSSGRDRTHEISLWQAIPSFKYLCHWEVKPPDSFFVVNRGLVPTATSFARYEPHKCLQNRTGARPATYEEVEAAAFVSEQLNWCPCLFLKDSEGEVISASLVQREVCSRPDPDKDQVASREFSLCQTPDMADSLCTRDDGSSPSVQILPRWCLAMSVADAFSDVMKARFCYDRLPGHACEAKAKWTCKQPFIPPNSIPFYEGRLENMKLAFGSIIDLECKPGYRFPGIYRTQSITCNRYLKWEITKPLDQDEKLTYVDDRRNREKAVLDLRCYVVNCSFPPDIPGFSWEIQENEEENLVPRRRTEGVFPYGTNVTYTCLEGTAFANTLNTHVATCSQDEIWLPFLPKEKQCKTVECPPPPLVTLSDLIVPYLAFGSPANYTCKRGYWFRRNEPFLISRCNASRQWEPDPNNERCFQVTCVAPDFFDLDRMKAIQIPQQNMNTEQTKITIMCLEGYWFDRKRHSVDFFCAADGNWVPFAPTVLQCVTVHCDVPPPVPGAVMWGSDNRAGNHMRYECASLSWIRRAFKLFSPHWNRCIRVTGGLDPEFYEPLNKPRPGSPVASATLEDSCDKDEDLRDVWAWHWSFHIRNGYTNKCLTATAIPTLKEDVVPVAVEECDRDNLYQQWTCSNAPDNSNARLLSLRLAERGAFLTTTTDEEAFWSGKDTVYLVITGDRVGTGVKSYWQVYGTDEDGEVNICVMREGHAQEEVVCNDYGRWIPDPRHMECTLVDCGPPPEVLYADISILEGNVSALSSSHFSAPNIWDYIGSSMKNRSWYPVLTMVLHRCHEGRWIEKGKFSGSLVCRESGIWQNADSGMYIVDPQDPKVSLVCQDVHCPAPRVLSHSVATVYPSVGPKYVDGVPVVPYRGVLHYTPGVNVTFEPPYASTLTAHCDEGYWLWKAMLRDIPHEVKNLRTPGTPILRSVCGADGNWTEPIVQTGMKCLPLTCPDPGPIGNSRRIPETREPSYGFGTIFQYQCDLGFWFSAARTYTESTCNKYGVWEPDTTKIECVKAQCRNPGPVPYAYRSGEDFTIGSKITFECSTGRLIGRSLQTKEIACMSDGFWFPPPLSIRCELLICDPLPKIPHSSFMNNSQVLREVFQAGDHTTLHCDVGYAIDTMTTSVQYTCDNNGRWVPDDNLRPAGELRCEPVHCNAPVDVLPSGAVLHGSVHLYKHGDLIRYYCKPGKWVWPNGYDTALEAMCVVKRNLAKTKTGGRQLPYVTEWVPDLTDSRCMDLQCPHPGVIEKSYLDLSGRGYMSTAAFTCEEGYKMSIPRYNEFTTRFVTLCRHDGKWREDPSTVTCIPVECPDPGTIPNAFRVEDARSTPPYFFNDIVEYKCIHGRYFMQLDAVGSSLPGKLTWRVTCLYDGTWEMLPADYFVSCELVQCLAPKFIPQADIYTDYSVSSGPAAVYPIDALYNITCLPGFVNSLYGMQHSSLRCSETGMWHPADPFLMTCERVHCHDPGFRDNSTRYITGFRLYDRVSYHGFPGFASIAIPPGQPRRIVTLECSITGQWKVLDPRNVSREGDSSLQDSDGNFPATRKKRQAASFPEDYITFLQSTCGPPAVSLNVTEPIIVIDATTDPPTNKTVWRGGDTLTLSCKPNYFIAVNVTTAIITCTDLVEWWPIPSHVRCFHMTDFYCDLPTPSENNTIRLTSYKMGETALVICYPGYEMRAGITEQEIQCREDRAWIPNSGLSCSEITCGPPINLANAGRNFTGRNYGDQANYLCDHGFSLTGLPNDTSFSVVCVHSNTWTPDPSLRTCIPIDCGSPAYLDIPNANPVTFTTTNYGSQAEMVCQPGFHVSTSPSSSTDTIKAVCGIEGQWRLDSIDSTALDSSLQYCAAIFCNQPPVINNSHVAEIIGGLSYQAKVEYRCRSGYRTLPPGTLFRVKTFTLTCGEDGNWTSDIAPNEYSCVKVTCPTLSAKPRSTITFLSPGSKARELGKVANFTCTAGFSTLYGSTVSLQCLWFGDWAPSPGLLECLSLQCPIPGSLREATGSGSRNVGGTWTYTCNTNYEFSSTSSTVSITCNADGKWVPEVSSLVPCRVKSCGPPVPVANSDVYLNDGTKVDVTNPNYYIPAETQVNFFCFDGYWDSGTFSVVPQWARCEYNGRYSPSLSSLDDCSPITCVSPQEVSGATSVGITGPGPSGRYPFGHQVVYTCTGVNFFKTERLKTVISVCGDSGRFEPDPVRLSCSPTKCSNYSMPLGFRTQITTLDYQGEATYSCKLGAWFGPNNFKRTYSCSEDGRWEPNITEVRCTPVSCTPPTITNAKPVAHKIEYGISVPMECKDGYYISGAVTVSCNDVGELTPPASTFSCELLRCVVPETPANTEVGNDTYYFGDSLEVRCLSGYWISPGVLSISATCQKDGSWSDNINTINCVPISCITPLVPQNGQIRGEESHYLSVVTTTCDPGYWVAGEQLNIVVHTCEKSGYWEPDIPTVCSQIECVAPIFLQFASMSRDGDNFDSPAIYTCVSLRWIAVKNDTHWVLTGKKSQKTVCTETGRWTPGPVVNFRCHSIYDGDIPVSQAGRLPKIKTGRNLHDEGPPYRTLITTLKADWVVFDPETMELSDSFVPPASDKARTFRDISFSWDRNPLTFWVAPTAINDPKFQWSIEIYLGKPMAVFGVMIMCPDDRRSDITTFTILFADRNKVTGRVGPFRVYGDRGIVGTPHSDFPLDFSSIATPWIFGGFAREMLWIHFIIHGTVDPYARAGVREIGIFASEAKWEWSYPVDPLPALILSSTFVAMLTLFGSVMYYLDQRSARTVLFTPPAMEKNAEKIPYKIDFCLKFDKKPILYQNMLIRLKTSHKSRFPVSWLRGNDHLHLFNNKVNYCAIKIRSEEVIDTDNPCIELNAWVVVDDPRIGYTRNDDCSDYRIKISEVSVTNQNTGEEWHSIIKHRKTRYLKREKPYGLSVCFRSVLSVPLYKVEHFRHYNAFLVKLLRCHNVIALFSPPHNSKMNRLERFFASMFYLIAGIVATVNLQIYFEAFPAADPAPNIELFSENKETVSREHLAIFGGDNAYITLAFIGSLLCIPVTPIIRYLYLLAKYVAEKREISKAMLYEFCSHRVFFHLSMLRIPFMKTLNKPLATLLGVILKDTPISDAATMVPAELICSNLFLNDLALQRRWSNPEMALNAQLYGSSPYGAPLRSGNSITKTFTTPPVQEYCEDEVCHGPPWRTSQWRIPNAIPESELKNLRTPRGKNLFNKKVVPDHLTANRIENLRAPTKSLSNPGGDYGLFKSEFCKNSVVDAGQLYGQHLYVQDQPRLIAKEQLGRVSSPANRSAKYKQLLSNFPSAGKETLSSESLIESKDESNKEAKSRSYIASSGLSDNAKTSTFSSSKSSTELSFKNIQAVHAKPSTSTKFASSPSSQQADAAILEGMFCKPSKSAFMSDSVNANSPPGTYCDSKSTTSENNNLVKQNLLCKRESISKDADLEIPPPVSCAYTIENELKSFFANRNPQAKKNGTPLKPPSTMSFLSSQSNVDNLQENESAATASTLVKKDFVLSRSQSKPDAIRSSAPQNQMTVSVHSKGSLPLPSSASDEAFSNSTFMPFLRESLTATNVDEPENTFVIDFESDETPTQHDNKVYQIAGYSNIPLLSWVKDKVAKLFRPIKVDQNPSESAPSAPAPSAKFLGFLKSRGSYASVYATEEDANNASGKDQQRKPDGNDPEEGSDDEDRDSKESDEDDSSDDNSDDDVNTNSSEEAIPRQKPTKGATKPPTVVKGQTGVCTGKFDPSWQRCKAEEKHTTAHVTTGFDPDCYGDKRLHHPVVTHTQYRKKICPAFSLRTILSSLITSGIIVLCIHLFFLGQQLGSNGVEEVYLTAFLCLVFNVFIVLFVDAAVAVFVFKELG